MVEKVMNNRNGLDERIGKHYLIRIICSIFHSLINRQSTHFQPHLFTEQTATQDQNATK
jgi:hypothetical protein